MSQCLKLSGKCLCGAAHLQVNEADAQVTSCHCDMCRRRDSSVCMSQVRCECLGKK